MKQNQHEVTCCSTQFTRPNEVEGINVRILQWLLHTIVLLSASRCIASINADFNAFPVFALVDEAGLLF